MSEVFYTEIIENLQRHLKTHNSVRLLEHGGFSGVFTEKDTISQRPLNINMTPDEAASLKTVNAEKNSVYPTCNKIF